eukprot:1516980-Prymnesium_polylepis.2
MLGCLFVRVAVVGSVRGGGSLLRNRLAAHRRLVGRQRLRDSSLARARVAALHCNLSAKLGEDQLGLGHAIQVCIGVKHSLWLVFHEELQDAFHQLRVPRRSQRLCPLSLEVIIVSTLRIAENVDCGGNGALWKALHESDELRASGIGIVGATRSLFGHVGAGRSCRLVQPFQVYFNFTHAPVDKSQPNGLRKPPPPLVVITNTRPMPQNCCISRPRGPNRHQRKRAETRSTNHPTLSQTRVSTRSRMNDSHQHGVSSCIDVSMDVEHATHTAPGL